MVLGGHRIRFRMMQAGGPGGPYPQGMRNGGMPPDRQQQIDCDRNLYWKNSVTFLVFDNEREIVGCVQIIHRSNGGRLPVEYASIANPDGSSSAFNLRKFMPGNDVTEIYRCRRSFELNKLEAINVLLMLFKAIWIYIVRTKTAYTCISYDIGKPELRHLYINKLAFRDPGIRLVFGDKPQQWCLLFKDWVQHEKEYAGLGKTQFYIQTWCRMATGKKHFHSMRRQTPRTFRRISIIGERDVVIAQTMVAPRRKRTRIISRSGGQGSHELHDRHHRAQRAARADPRVRRAAPH